MSKNLVIVESPEKAKIIGRFLGEDYRVLSSKGHIRDIEGTGKNSLGVDFDNNYEPNYVLDSTKTHLIQTLRDEARRADMVWLASDEDREGEAIAWHLKEVLGLKSDKTRRIVFHEITKTAIDAAIANPRDIDYNLVGAQQARRVMDRIVGFELSPVLWKKITTGLSAGRVQSVAVRLIVEREREIEEFVPQGSYRVSADFIGKNMSGEEVTLRTELNHRFATKEEAIAFLESLTSASFTVQDIQKKPGKKVPAAPFTTSSLQQEAARKLHFPVAKTMRVAQSLYEAGHITYMRTDSVNLSSLAIGTSKEEVNTLYGSQYHKARNYKTTSKGAQEAHEAIRPTFMSNHTVPGSADEKHLYDLIWKRTLASQMADAEVETTRIEVAVSGSPYVFVASGEVVLFDGFMRVYVQSTDDDNEESADLLPQMQRGEALKARLCTAQESFTKAPQRYTEASLVKKMDELGIGRPSTYATIIETIQSRHYVERGSVTGQKRDYVVLSLRKGQITEKIRQDQVGQDNNKLLPTDLGRATNDYLVAQFADILSYDFTADAEKSFDRVAEGKAEWAKVVDKFYKKFHPMILGVGKGKIEARLLGTDPATGKPVYAKIGKNGPVVQLGSSESDEKPRFTSLDKGQSIYSLTLEEALQLFAHAMPYTLCTYKDEEVVVGEGKYGAYLRVGKEYVSIPKSINPLHITEEEALQLLEKQQKMQEPILSFDDLQVMNGRYGAYIKYGSMNYKIPRALDPSTLTHEQCLQIIEKATKEPAETPKKGRFSRKK